MKYVENTDSIKSKIRSSIITKVAVVIVFLIFLFSVVMFTYIDISIKKTLKDISSEQMKYIELQIQKREIESIRRELDFIKLYSRSVESAVKDALYNLNKDVVKDILKNFIKIGSIKKITIYDNIAKNIFLVAEKSGNRVLFLSHDDSKYANLRFFRYGFKIDDKNIGYMKIYYDTKHIRDKIKKDAKEELQKIKEGFKDRIKTIERKQMAIFFILIGYILLIVFTIIVILRKYIKEPLGILYTNLHSFFRFLDSSSLECELIPYESNDEFGIISSKLNDNMKRAIKLHKKLSYFIEVLDKHVMYAQYDLEGNYLQVSSAFCKISGYKREEMLKRNHFDSLATEKEVRLYKSIKKMAIPKEYNITTKHRKKDGTIYYLSSAITPKLDKNNKVYKYTEIMHDVTYEKELIKVQQEIENTQKEIIYTIGTISEERSHETGAHIKRVTSYVKILAKYMGFSKKEIKLIKIASAMHDVGKIAIPDHILNKPGKLTPEEFDIMKKHTTVGYDMLKHSKRDLLKAAAIIALTHHEKYDGTGYPKGLKGEEIHIYGRIAALADVFDALGSKRVYKEAWDDEKIFDYILEQSGKHFDPVLVDIFFKHKDEFLHIKRKFS